MNNRPHNHTLSLKEKEIGFNENTLYLHSVYTPLIDHTCVYSDVAQWSDLVSTPNPLPTSPHLTDSTIEMTSYCSHLLYYSKGGVTLKKNPKIHYDNPPAIYISLEYQLQV